MSEETTQPLSEMVAGVQGPWYQRRWWLRTREVEPAVYAGGLRGASHEVYTPWWAWPLEWLHRLFFGAPKFETLPPLPEAAYPPGSTELEHRRKQ